MTRSDNMKRLCVFAHFDNDNIIDEYVLFYLQDIRKVADRIVFVSTSYLTSEMLSMLKNICDDVIIRKNEGYDFASWQTALKSEELKDFDELILCNDSVYGPLFPLEQVFSAMRRESCDFWGITSSFDIAYHIQSYFLVFRKTILVSNVFRRFWESTIIPKSKQKVIKLCEIGLSQTLLNAGFKASTYSPYRILVIHAILYRLRFYLLMRGKKISEYVRVLWFRTPPLEKISFITFLRRSLAFISTYRHHRKDRRRRNLGAFITKTIISVVNIVSKMSNILRNGPSEIIDFIRDHWDRLRGLILNFEIETKSLNPTHFFWKQLILYSRMPFIKVDLLRDNPMCVNIDDYAKVVSMVSNYNVPMIMSHLRRVRNESRETSNELF